ncbi:hypothetical protein KAFR_0K00210 [Kazachstania africana CBS 2517]|uniref:WAC domain-containing protein n=1 Tax=Kazachstania africana (strain ATCC 22294 / BCRC 22015 / CBS 2517 / CECT 1963 / NBRC 1671 / NRRL Y-8276) TaxID=1071382 RepID=H2B176_KAZAF|nr:hypothetical protein KAFR_0K00210 [Kazachstania africana CBS 2517]CCF60376.1 hypothetical protein KAFR_0K00210 [Kazachstania africana CBS 2517]
MILYKNQVFEPPVPQTLPPNLNVPVWTIPQTGEWFMSFAEYLKRMSFYQERSFSCEFSNSKHYTYFTALAIESEERNCFEKALPLTLRIAIAKKLLSQNVSTLDSFIKDTLKETKKEFYLGEKVKVISRKAEVSKINPENTYKIIGKMKFDEIIDPETREIIIPNYFKYRIVDDKPSFLKETLIVDHTQIERDGIDLSFSILKRFISMILNNGQALQNQVCSIKSKYILEYGLNKRNYGVMEEDSANRSSSDFMQEIVNRKIESTGIDGPNSILKNDAPHNDYPILNEATSTSSNATNIESIRTRIRDLIETGQNEAQNNRGASCFVNQMDDLHIPFTVSSHVVSQLHRLDSNLDLVPIKSNDKFRPSKTTGRLLEIHQFIFTFHSVLKVSQFSFEQLIASLKCTDPQQLAGEAVKVYPAEQLSSKGDGNEKLSTWEGNYTIRSLIESKAQNDLALKYKIIFKSFSKNDIIEEMESSGAHLVFDIFKSLLSMLVDKEGYWGCPEIEKWTEDRGKNESSEIVEKLSSIPNFQKDNWVERLFERHFQNGYWVVILVGLMKDIVHVNKYKTIIQSFIQNTTNWEIIPISLGPYTYRSFCSNLTLEQKVDILWVLVDIVSTYSTDVRAAIDVSESIFRGLESESMKVTKSITLGTSAANELETSLKHFRETQNYDIKVADTYKAHLIEIVGKLEKLERYRDFLGSKLSNQSSARALPVGFDKYGNSCYFFTSEINRVLSLSTLPVKMERPYHHGGLWLRGPREDDALLRLGISKSQLSSWKEIALKEGKIAATKQVFKVFQKNNRFYKIEGDKEVELMNENGVVNGSLTSIQMKIIEETPQNLLLSDEEWLFFNKYDAVQNFLMSLEKGGHREYILISNLMLFMPRIKRSFTVKEPLYGTDYLDSTEIMYWKDLDDLGHTNDKDACVNGLSCEFQKSKDQSQNLEIAASRLTNLYDSTSSKKLLATIKKISEATSQPYKDSLVSPSDMSVLVDTRGEDASASSTFEKNLGAQANILTALLNHRPLKNRNFVRAWRNRYPSMSDDPSTDEIDVNIELEKVLQGIRSEFTGAASTVSVLEVQPTSSQSLSGASS